MTNVDLNRCYPEVATLAVHEAAHELHLIVLEWMAQPAAPRALMAVLERATRRTSEALLVARHSRSHERHLRRSREDMWICLARFKTLRDSGGLPLDLCQDALSRVNQILLGLDQLSVTPMDAWLELKLPPRVSIGDRQTVASERKALQKKIATVANTSVFYEHRLEPALKKRERSDPALIQGPPNGKVKDPPHDERSRTLRESAPDRAFQVMIA